jgi:hypothetical protein
MCIFGVSCFYPSILLILPILLVVIFIILIVICFLRCEEQNRLGL